MEKRETNWADSRNNYDKLRRIGHMRHLIFIGSFQIVAKRHVFLRYDLSPFHLW
jgi:hypothetical protein